MERHKCKLCSKRFKCGRALGGHMRSHFTNLPVPLKTSSHFQLTDSTESSSSASSSEDEDEKGLVYGLRENPKKSIKLVDPEFSFIADASESVVLQDRESETESRNPARKRSRRVNKKLGIEEINERKDSKQQKWDESLTEQEPVSSVSDTSPEEDVAMCLMMLSRDKWMKKEEESLAADESHENKLCLDKFKCETCYKVFPTYQALGGHRAAHKRMKSSFQDDEIVEGTNSIVDMKVHECSLCYKVFGSGQALGGHKRAHLLSSTSGSVAADKCVKVGGCLIDLNLPAPLEDDEEDFKHIQLEVSAVSFVEFIKPIKS